MNLGFTTREHRGGIARMKAWECPALLIAEDTGEAFLLLGEGTAMTALDGDGKERDPDSCPRARSTVCNAIPRPIRWHLKAASTPGTTGCAR
jgi:hypothetical protein